MNKSIATVVNFARSQLDRHKHLPEGSILGVVLKKREWADFVEEAERMSAVNAELLAVLKEVDITDEELIYALGSNHANQIRSAIARAEQAEERP